MTTIPPPRDVWADNLEFEMCLVRDAVERFPYVALDVSFAGPVARPIGNFRGPTDFYYQTVRVNVDCLKVLEVGFTFADAAGRLAPGCCTWVFHFEYDAAADMGGEEAREVLGRAAQVSPQTLQHLGPAVARSLAALPPRPVDWEAHRTRGIQVHHFGELLTTSGLVLTDDVRWLAYHSGYEMAFLCKILSLRPLPQEEAEFFELARLFFPLVYDIRYVAKSAESLPGAPGKLLEEIEQGRGGGGRPAWPACDPARVAAEFFRLRQIMLERDFDDAKIVGRLAPLGAS